MADARAERSRHSPLNGEETWRVLVPPLAGIAWVDKLPAKAIDYVC